MPKLAVIWRSAALLLATGAESVIEVLPPVAWRQVPGVPEWVRGVFDYRGDLIPLIDSEKLLLGPRNGAAESLATADQMVNRVLVVRVASTGNGPTWPVGLWVGSILELDHIDFEAPHTHPGFDTQAARFLGPIASTRWGLVQLVNPAELFTPEQITMMSSRMAEASP
jgi:chemotaxis-related protein WspB